MFLTPMFIKLSMERQDKEYKHWFECMYPVLKDKEKEIFYQHPLEDIKCNQLGVLYYNEERYTTYDLRSGSVVREHYAWNGVKAKIIGTKLKIIWECYHNNNLASGSQFLFTNGNPLDLTMENVLAINRIDEATKKEVTKIKARFIQNSVEHLIKLEAKYEKRGIEQKQLHDLLQIPNWLVGARKRYKGAIPKALQKYVK